MFIDPLCQSPFQLDSNGTARVGGGHRGVTEIVRSLESTIPQVVSIRTRSRPPPLRPATSRAGQPTANRETRLRARRRRPRHDLTDSDTHHALHGLTPRNLGRRFTAVAKAAGIKARLTAHSGRVGLASELQAPNVGYTYAGLLLEFEAQ